MQQSTETFREIPLSKKQKEAWNALKNENILEVLYGGGGRSGKTFLGAEYFILSCLEFECSSWLVGRQSLKKLKRTTLLTFFKALRFLGLEAEKDYKFNGQDTILYFSRANGSFENCSKIFFEEMAMTPSDPLFDRLGSYDLTGGWIDECQETVKQAKDALQTRYSVLSGTNCDGTVWETTGTTLLTCNPKKNWIYSDFVKPSRDGTIDDTKRFIPALFTDNPFIDQKKYKDGVLSTKNKILIERLLHGNFDYDDDPNRIFEFDKLQNAFTNSFIQKTGQKYISADIALQGSDKFVVCVWNGFVLEKIYSIAKCTAKEAEMFLRQKAEYYMIPRGNIVYDHDGLGAFLGSYLQGAKSFVNNSTARNGENYSNLKSQCYFALAKKINNDEIFISDPEFREQIIAELEQVKQKNADTDGKIAVEGKEKMKEVLGHSPDFADAVMMRMFFEMEKRGGSFFVLD